MSMMITCLPWGLLKFQPYSIQFLEHHAIKKWVRVFCGAGYRLELGGGFLIYCILAGSRRMNRVYLLF